MEPAELPIRSGPAIIANDCKRDSGLARRSAITQLRVLWNTPGDELGPGNEALGVLVDRREATWCAFASSGADGRPLALPMSRVTLMRRAVGAASRRLGRPELLAAFYPVSAQILREEIAISAVLSSVLRSDSTFVDVGANRGQILRDAVRLAPDAEHIAFEPIPALAVEVARTFPDVDCRRLALGARPEVAEFCHFTSLDGWSGLQRSPEISDERGRPEYIEVRVSTLDSELDGLQPSVIKIDVEGAELQVLEGGREVLCSSRPVLIFEHVAAAARLYDSPPGSPWDLLAELGYRVFTVTGEGPITRSTFVNNTSVVNWLATPKMMRSR